MMDMIGNAKQVVKGTTVHIHNSTIHELTIGVTQIGAQTNQTTLKKKPIELFRQPTSEFVTCKPYTEIKEQYIIRRNFGSITRFSRILHLHGLPGSGKSEIARKLIADFPCDPDELLYVKYHIDCNDSFDDLEEGLKDLIHVMYDHNLLTNKSIRKSACRELARKRASAFVQLLVESDVPIFILVEDPPQKRRELLIDLLRAVDSSQPSKHLHICITSVPRSICQLGGLQCYHEYQIHGLTSEEGLQLLDVELSCEEGEKKAARDVIEFLSGSPLGLVAVKSAAKRARISYRSYLEQIRHNTENHRMEAKDFQRDYGEHQLHIFDSLIKLLDIRSGSADSSLWKTIGILAFCHHGGIPQRLIGKIMGFHKENGRDLKETFFTNERESGSFISEVEDCGIAKVSGSGYWNTRVTFHQVVFQAVRLRLQERGCLQSRLRDAVFAVSSVVYKDVRTPSDKPYLRSMIPHLMSVLGNTLLDKTVREDFVARMSVVRLQKILGVEDSATSDECAKKNLEEALRNICIEVRNTFANSLDINVMINNQIESACNVARLLADSLLRTGESLQSKKAEVAKYLSLAVQLQQYDVEFFKTFPLPKELAKHLENAANLSIGFLQTIYDQHSEYLAAQSHKPESIVLDLNIQCRVFFFEHLASALYTQGRYLLRCDQSTIHAMRKRYLWILELVHALCIECKRLTGVSLLLLRRSAAAKVALNLKSIASLEKSSKKKILLESRSTMKELLDVRSSESEAFFENGLRKSVDNIFDRLTNLRYVLRIETRLLPLCEAEEREALTGIASQHYERMYTLATDNLSWYMSPKCIAYCGKYMAANGEYERAIEHFREALDSPQIQYDKASLFPWVCYNCARAVLAGRLQINKQEAIAKCRQALLFRDEIAEEDLIGKLEKQLKSLLLQ